MGFDLRVYKANPIASIGTTLKRMVPGYLESSPSGSGTLYRQRKRLRDSITEEPLVNLAPLYNIGEIGPDPKPNSAQESQKRTNGLPGVHRKVKRSLPKGK